MGLLAFFFSKMAITLSDLRTQARQRADMVNSTFVSDSELTGYVNAAAGELHDLLVLRYEDYFTQASNATADSSGRIAIPSDMLKLRSLTMTEGGTYYPLSRIDVTEQLPYLNSEVSNSPFRLDLVYFMSGSYIHTLPTSDTANKSFGYYYVKCFTPLSADADTLFTQGELQRWSEYVVVDAAIRCLQKEESDVSVLMTQKAALLDRIKRAAAGRDANKPARVVEVDEDVGYIL